MKEIKHVLTAALGRPGYVYDKGAHVDHIDHPL